MKCKICGNAINNKYHEAQEMMFGLKDKFTYVECSKCDCLQLSEIPQDMSTYYPPYYYSFSSEILVSNSRIKKILIRRRDKYAVFSKGVIGKFLFRLFPDVNLCSLSKINLSRKTSILDVGCGSGKLLHTLKEIGFENLLGIDPYLDEDIEYENGLKVIKKTVHEISGEWDLIMFHHSFEHIADQLESLVSVSKLLSKDGVCLIRVPTVSSYAWNHYGVNWVQLDAPRHFFLHSIESMRILAEQAGLGIQKTIYDSDEFQFWGSEQYLKGIPLSSNRSYKVKKVKSKKSIFSIADIQRFKRESKKLNQKKQGDQVAFYLKKIK